MTFLFPDNLGKKILDRFELSNLSGIFVLYCREQGIDMSIKEAEQVILKGESNLYLQRRYTDGSKRLFRILKGGSIELVERSSS